MVVTETGRKLGRSRVPLVTATGRAGLVTAAGAPILHQFGSAQGNLFSGSLANHSAISARLNVFRSFAASIASESTIFGDVTGSDASFNESHSALAAALAVDRPLAAALASASALSGDLSVLRPFALDVIQALNLTTGLQLCLDAGDEDSYGGSGQVWSDRSGNGYDFLLGTTSSAQASDPTFNGSAGSIDAYWSFDGGDFFTLGQANPTWVNNIGKNNAKYALCGWVQIGSLATDNDLVGNFGSTSNACDWGLWFRTNGSLRLDIDGSGADALFISSTITASAGAKVFFGVQVDEPLGTGFFQINETQEAQVTTYGATNPNNSAASLRLAASGATGAIPMSNGSRMMMFNAWEGTIPSASDLLAFYNATKARFGH